MLRLACLLTALAAPALAGDGLTVNSTLDLPDADLGDGVCDADLLTEGLQITLRAAVMHANETPGADTIAVPAGLYKLAVQGFDEEAAEQGDLDVTDDLTIVGAGWATTIVDGKKAKDRVFDLHSGASLVLEGFTIRRGTAPFKDTDPQRGGGIRSVGDLTLRGMQVSKCRTGDSDGAGISHGTGALLIEDTVLQGNRSGDDAGGIDIRSGATAVLNRVSFARNKAKENGGAIEVSDAEADAENCTFSANIAAAGGAVSIENGSSIALVNCTLARNKAKAGSGISTDGGVGAVELGNCIMANKATTNFAGGGLVSLGGNLDSGSTCGFDSPADLEDSDPRLLKLAGETGELLVHQLKSDSPCIDAGDDLQCPAADQLGQARVDVAEVGSATCDIGAVEFQG